MADTADTRLDRWPGPILSQRSRSRDGIGYMDEASIKKLQRDNLAQDCRVEGDDTALLSAAGAVTTSTTVEIDVSAGFGRVAGLMATVAALNDQAILGAGAWIYSAGLDGAEPSMIADGNGSEVALCLCEISGALQLVAVFGAEALIADPPAEPTGQECRDALAAAAARSTNPLTGLDPEAFLVVSRFLLARTGAAVAQTHADPATDDALKAERLRGYSLEASS